MKFLSRYLEIGVKSSDYFPFLLREQKTPWKLAAGDKGTRASGLKVLHFVSNITSRVALGKSWSMSCLSGTRDT